MNSNIYQIKTDCTTYDENHNINHGDLPLIPSRKYEAVMKTWFTGTLHKAAKVVLVFTITSGEYFGVDIPKYYNVKKLKTKAGKRGKFIAKPRGDFLKDFYKVLPDHPKVRCNEIPITKLQEQPIEITVDTVKKDYKQNDYPEQLYYSVVREVNRFKKINR
jgi:hypothetical protein